jgi:hypothetical protein
VIGYASQVLGTLLTNVEPPRPPDVSGARNGQKKKAGYPAGYWFGLLKDYAYLFLLFVKIGAISPPC